MSASASSRPSLLPVRDDIAYILPMAVFLILTQAGASWPAVYPLTYVTKTLLAAGLLVVLRPHFTRIRWNYSWLGVIVGVIGVFQWIGMEKFLLAHADTVYQHLRMTPEPFDPTRAFTSVPERYAFIAFRWAGAVLLVPFMEELFWRDFAWRSVIAPNDFKLARVGEMDGKALIVVALIFSLVHIQWPSAIVWALMIGGLLVLTRSLGACIVAHAVTNFLLGAYVLYTHDWAFW